MTDITELAQQELAQLRAELSNQAIGSKDHLRKIALSLVDKLEKCRDREIRWLALSNEKSKIITDQEEALEKAQAKADVYDMLRDDYGLRKKGVGLADFVDWQANRIAELESRIVKLPLPSCTYADHSYPAYSKRQVISLLESLGITVVEGDV